MEKMETVSSPDQYKIDRINKTITIKDRTFKIDYSLCSPRTKEDIETASASSKYFYMLFIIWLCLILFSIFGFGERTAQVIAISVSIFLVLRSLQRLLKKKIEKKGRKIVYIFLLIFIWIALFLCVVMLGVLVSMTVAGNSPSTMAGLVSIITSSIFMYGLDVFMASLKKKGDLKYTLEEKRISEKREAMRSYRNDMILAKNAITKIFRKNIPIFTNINENHDFIQSELFESFSMESLMCQVAIKAVLLNADGVVITQSHVSNEVSGYQAGYVSGHSGSIRGHSSGETTTSTSYSAHVSFVKKI